MALVPMVRHHRHILCLANINLYMFLASYSKKEKLHLRVPDDGYFDHRLVLKTKYLH